MFSNKLFERIINLKTKNLRRIELKIALFCFYFFICSVSANSQEIIKIYAWDTDYSYHPNDIIERPDNGFFITGDVNSSLPYVENEIFKKFFIISDSLGNVDSCYYLEHNYHGGSNIIQMNTGGFLSFGRNSSGYTCDGAPSVTPFSDYFIRYFNENCEYVSDNQINNDCWDYINDYCKDESGSLSVLSYTKDLSFEYKYLIKEIKPWGDVNDIYLSTGSVFQIEKNDSNYIVCNNSNIFWVSSDGVTIAEYPLPLFDYVADFIPTIDDNLLFAFSTPEYDDGDSVRLIKTDTTGIIIWNKIFHLKTTDVMEHSTGNYILTGTLNGDPSILVINNNGDSVYGKTYGLGSYTFPIKTIETFSGKIAILAGINGSEYQRKVLLIIDFFPGCTNLKSKELTPELNVFPNPAQDWIYIETSGFSEILNVELFDFSGKLIQLNECNTARNYGFNIKYLCPGMYIIKIQTPENVFFRKIIKD